MIEPSERQFVLDTEHLRLLVIGYFVSAGIHAAFALFPLIYVAMGIAMASIPVHADAHGPSPRAFGIIFAAIGLGIFAITLGIAALQFQAARNIRARRASALSLVAAAVSCLLIPYGTLLGVFTFLVLERPTVKAMLANGPLISGSVQPIPMPPPIPPNPIA